MTSNRAMKRLGFAGVLVGAVTLASCDFDVTNPGPVQDQFLNDPAAQPALVDGMGRAVAEAWNWIGYTSAAVAREIHPSGSTGSFGITARWQRGELSDTEVNTQWSTAQRARWLADEGIRLIMENGEAEDGLLAQAYLWSGYANRLLGENMCQTVIDGGGAMPHTENLNLALAAFNQAATLGTGDVQMAAIAGRASVHAQLGDYASALTDAGMVPDDFSYAVPFYAGFGDATRIRLVFATAAEPYKAHSQWSTWISDPNGDGSTADAYGLSDHNPTGDPRVAYTVTDEDGDAAIECCGTVPWWPQFKYEDPQGEGDVEFSSGAEMRLLEAEAAIVVDMDAGAAIGIVNDLRTAAGQGTVSGATLAEAGTLFKREHAIEMWLEGRRLPALRRWDEQGVVGDLQPLETVSGDVNTGSHLAQRDFCFPISLNEKQTNTNVS